MLNWKILLTAYNLNVTVQDHCYRRYRSFSCSARTQHWGHGLRSSYFYPDRPTQHHNFYSWYLHAAKQWILCLRSFSLSDLTPNLHLLADCEDSKQALLICLMDSLSWCSDLPVRSSCAFQCASQKQLSSIWQCWIISCYCC